MRFIMLGGFLGSGKTTTLTRLAQHYADQGKHVAIVTNDQAEDLVDTQLVERSDDRFAVDQVAGSCFCCDFKGLMKVIEGFEQGENSAPDIVLAEPVGSCTDLVATVIKPMLEKYPDKFSLAPYAVLLKPSEARQVLAGKPGELTRGAAYIFSKQLEEADAIVLNRLDTMSAEEAELLLGLAKNKFPEAQTFAMSALTGEGFSALTDMVEQPSDLTRASMEVDYELYAQGEADLGWLNAIVDMTPSDSSQTTPLPLNHAVTELVGQISQAVRNEQGVIAHIKLLAQHDQAHAVANVVDQSGQVHLTRSSEHVANISEQQPLRWIINARVGLSPESLREQVIRMIEAFAKTHQLSARITRDRCFKPAPPQPTHRVA